MKSVRHVSIVLLLVAETERVTERPKKLKPLLKHISYTDEGTGWGGANPILIMIRTLLTAMLLK